MVRSMNAQASLSPAQATGKVACRLIELSDIPALVDLLTDGFPERDRTYWERGLDRLGRRPAIDGFPRYGYLLSADGQVVGCLLLIVSRDGQGRPRANVSSWYARPSHRSLASMLVSFAFRQKELTFINISPAPHTIPILEAQGYKRFVDGQMMALPLLSAAGIGARVVDIGPGPHDRSLLPDDEMALLERHASWGCLSFVCIGKGGGEPFVFVRDRPMRGVVPTAQLVWCRDPAALARFSGAIGRHLLLRGIVLAVIDADGPIAGLPGMFREGRTAKFYRGAHRPRIGDLTDTELVVFGV